jgi:hypothetical protein
MQTRSQLKNIHQNLYEVDIDFDSASKAWRANKISIGNGSFKYKPSHRTEVDDDTSNNAVNGYNLRRRKVQS